jgi:hypothetical protein
MNDPGTKDLVSNAADDVEKNLPDTRKDEGGAEEMTFMKPR